MDGNNGDERNPDINLCLDYFLISLKVKKEDYDKFWDYCGGFLQLLFSMAVVPARLISQQQKPWSFINGFKLANCLFFVGCVVVSRS